MKFRSEVIINVPQDKLVELWTNPAMLKNHQEGFLRKELLNGSEGQIGAVSKIYFQHGKHEMELTETIIDNQLPNFLESFYQHKHMDNTLKTTFTKVNDNQTLYIVEGEYVTVRGMMPKLMIAFLPNMFRRQPKKWMDNFKRFAESV